MNHRVSGVLLLIAAAVVAAVLGGCAGDAAHFAAPIQSDEILGHWLATAQSASLTGTRSAVTSEGDVSFVFTQSGLPTWSGVVTNAAGEGLFPAHGAWARTADSYSLSNDQGQTALFAWSGSDLYSTTRANGVTVYLWWTQQ